ncbi:MAG: ABC transporter permease [Leptospirales bacterium]
MRGVRNLIRRVGVSGALLLLLGMASLFAEFLAPYRYDSVRFDLPYAPAVWPRLEHGRLVVPVLRMVDPVHRRYAETGSLLPLRLFCRGESVRMWGLFPTSRHLFCTPVPARILLLGADLFGRDLFSRLLYGMRVSFLLSFLGVTISFAIGTLVGLVAGYAGGWTDRILMRTAEVVMAVPALYLLMGLRSIVPYGLSGLSVALVITGSLSLIGWASLARVVRGLVRSLVSRDFVLAAVATGASPARIILRHLLPNMRYYLLVAVTLSIPAFIVGEAGLSFLGLGLSEPRPSLGNILAEGQSLETMESAPWLLAAGGTIVLLVVLFNRLGDVLREAEEEIGSGKIQGRTDKNGKDAKSGETGS